MMIGRCSATALTCSLLWADDGFVQRCSPRLPLTLDQPQPNPVANFRLDMPAVSRRWFVDLVGCSPPPFVRAAAFFDRASRLTVIRLKSPDNVA
jgi:hypothetical protein